MSWWSAPSILETRLRAKMLVTMKDGTTFAGVLFESDATALVLRQAEAVGGTVSKSNVPLDGEIILLLSDVLYMQRA